ncbi:hypothetical protein OH77DRAFT_1428723 [Trametes cingulata]|nr:hypothetical protein OH77DRAFT_1428723 [Trametes cingulata]
MAPVLTHCPPPALAATALPAVPLLARDISTNVYFNAERASWMNPSDILTILMLVGGDVVHRAIAQLAGAGPGSFAPVAFSFGWVTYSFSALLSAVGYEESLLPQPAEPCTLSNVRTGITFTNKSWVLDCVMRYQERRTARRRRYGMEIEVYRVLSVGRPGRDWAYWLGVVTILLQLGVAVVPGVLHDNWIVLIIAGGGTLLALCGAALPQWNEAKFAARPVRKGEEQVVCLTRGNGSRAVMVLVNSSLRLDDMANANSKRDWFTAAANAVMSVLWVVLLLVVEGVEQDGWYVLAIGGIGMVHNVVAAGAQRDLDALGFQVEKEGRREGEDVISAPKMMHTLIEAEERIPGVGLTLLPMFFPGGLRADEQAYWDESRARFGA